MPRATKGQRFGGRQKGSLNKLTAEAKQAVAIAAEGLGGIERLIEWAKEAPKNEFAFWTMIYTKLIPLTVAGDPNNPLQLVESNAAFKTIEGTLEQAAIGKAASSFSESGVDSDRKRQPVNATGNKSSNR